MSPITWGVTPIGSRSHTSIRCDTHVAKKRRLIFALNLRHETICTATYFAHSQYSQVNTTPHFLWCCSHKQVLRCNWCCAYEIDNRSNEHKKLAIIFCPLDIALTCRWFIVNLYPVSICCKCTSLFPLLISFTHCICNTTETCRVRTTNCHAHSHFHNCRNKSSLRCSHWPTRTIACTVV